MKEISLVELKDVLEIYDFTELHIHHTYSPDHADFDGSNHFDLQEGMRDYHVNTRGWRDIGQHLTLFPDGVFLTGRDFMLSPASANNHNGVDGVSSHPLSVEMIGNFMEGYDTFEGKQLNAMVELAKMFYNIDKPIFFHRELNATSCPGTSIEKEWFMSMLKEAKFSDVDGHWAEADILDLIEKGLMSGYEDGTFKPNKPVTRAEMASVINRLIKRGE